MNKSIKLVLTAILVALSCNMLHSQSVPFINAPSDPYSSSMGGVTLTLESNPFTVQNNASAMTLANRTVYAGGSAYLLGDSFMARVSGFSKIGKLAIGINARYQNHPEYAVTSEQGYISGTYKPLELAAEVGAAYRIFGGLAVGANVRYIISDMGEEYKGNAFCADLSATYKLGNLTVAAAATNIGSKIDYTSNNPHNLPAMGKVGVGYTLSVEEKQKINISVEGDYLLYHSAFMAGAGVEYDYNDMVRVRGGYHYGDDTVIPSFVSVGVGFKFAGFTLDASYLTNGALCASIGFVF